MEAEGSPGVERGVAHNLPIRGFKDQGVPRLRVEREGGAVRLSWGHKEKPGLTLGQKL
jgi:hypothetical protein